MVRAMLIEANTPLQYCGESLTTASYLINRLPSRTLNFLTPLETLQKSLPSLPIPHLSLKVFGCTAFVHIPHHARHKLEPRAIRCVFVGYGVHQKGYRCYHPLTRRMYITMDVTFHEQHMFFFYDNDCKSGGEKK